MKYLVQHLLQTNMEKILNASYSNCHALGVHSIMLLDSPQKSIRLYVLDEGHELYRNFPSVYYDTPMSVGFHAHHCDLVLEVLTGSICNWEVCCEINNHSFSAKKYNFSSKIKNDELKFEYIGDVHLRTKRIQHLSSGSVLALNSKQLHTIACNKGEVASWLVYEQKEDPEYTSFLYTNCNPNDVDSSLLYQKMDEPNVLKLLTSAGLLSS